MARGEARRGRARRRRRRAAGGLVVTGLFALVVAIVLLLLPPGARSARPPSTPATGRRTPPTAASPAAAHLPFPSPAGSGLRPGPNLAPGSDPSVLPGDVLIADEGNDRLVVVDPAGNVVWQYPPASGAGAAATLTSPDDAFFAPGGKDIIVTQENDQVISLVDIAGASLLWRYGQPGVPGSGPNQLSNPDDAMMLPDGNVLVADIKNCSLLVIRSGSHVPAERIGIQDTACLHDPPLRFGSPNGAFPLADGNYLVTEINGDWVDEMTLGGTVLWSTHPPGVAYPSDTNEVSPGVYLTADYSTPGQIVEFDRQGHLLWRYGPTSGPGMLNQPSLCEPIPTNGDILCNDDGDDRVIVVDPRTDRIVWQYGHDGVPGRAAGYLSGPDGVDLAPPTSLLVRNAPHMGLPSFSCSPGLPVGACTVFGPG